MKEKNTVTIFLDDDPKPLGKFEVPINFEIIN